MFHGSMVALVTPMDEEGVIDVNALRHLVDWHIAEKTDALVVLGTTGESPTIPETERTFLIETVLEQVAGRLPVIIGTGSNSTDATLRYTKEAMELGADACLIVTPYYNKPTQEGLYQHFKTVADAVAIPQILYNVPSRTGCDLLPETIARLAEFPNIIGVKEATGNLDRLVETKALVGDKIDFYSGDDPTAMDFMLQGGKGVISITSNVTPRLMHDMCHAALAGEKEKAIALNSKLAKLHKDLCIQSNPIPVKWVLYTMGIIPAGIRLPLTILSETCHETVREAMREAGIAI
ncbi:MAG: dihydrodipicolinate synthase [Gammaproteobacteria bacterium]|jgi:4-hydroxy-tetrahydrodipicolinate synthase|nr:dihydrodipicolinate synthase [Gammaproteobacteria bacterium]